MRRLSYLNLALTMNYPSLQFYCSIKDGEIHIDKCEWPEESDIAQVQVDPDGFPGIEYITDNLPYPVRVIDAGFDVWKRSRVIHLIKLNGLYPIIRFQYQARKFWSFWRWWEVRIIQTLAVWGLAEIHPGEIPGWYCVNR